MGTDTALQSRLDLGSSAELHSLRCPPGPVLFSVIHSDSDPLWEPPEQRRNRSYGWQAKRHTDRHTMMKKTQKNDRLVSGASKQVKTKQNKQSKRATRPLDRPIKCSWGESKRATCAIHQERHVLKIAFRSIRSCHLFFPNDSEINGIQPGW